MSRWFVVRYIGPRAALVAGFAVLLVIMGVLALDSMSLTGDWPEYFEAMDLGVADFLAYPLIPGEFQRIIRTFPDTHSINHAHSAKSS